MKFTIKPAVRIDSVHCAAICEEIGYRLRRFLDKDKTELPAHLGLLLDKLREMECDESPSIVPSFEDIKALDNAETLRSGTSANASLSRIF